MTIIECIVLIAMIVILSTGCLIVVDRMQQNIQTAAAVHELYSLCIYAHMQAQLRGTAQKIVFYPDRQSYMVCDKLYAFPKGVIFGGNQSIHALGPPSKPDHILSSFITFVNKTIIFYPDGTMQAGVVYFGHQKQSRVYAISSSVRDPFFIRLYCYERGVWRLV